MLAAPPTDDRLDACPSCGGHLLVTEAAEPIVAQRVEIVVAPLVIHEHRNHPGYCPCCVGARRFQVGRWARRWGV